VTEKDDEIRASTVPERLFNRLPKVLEIDEFSVNEEAMWIINKSEKLTKKYWAEYDEALKKEMVASVIAAIKLIHEEHCEVPYIKDYRYDAVKDVHVRDKLWDVYDLDEQVSGRKTSHFHFILASHNTHSPTIQPPHPHSGTPSWPAVSAPLHWASP